MSVAAGVLFFGAGLTGQAWAQRAETPGEVVGLMADGSPALEIARSFGRAIDHEDDLRVLAITGNGPVQTLTDLLRVRGVDVALVPSDTARYAGSNGLMDAGKFAYLAKIASLDVHVVARRGIATLAGIAAKRVAVGTTGDYSFVAASLIFEAAGIAIEPLPLGGRAAIEAVAAGAADAAVIVGMKPLLQSIGADSGLRLLTVPFDEKLAETYIPSILSHEDYPGLVEKDKTAETVATGLVIAVIDWPKTSARYDKIRRFTDALLDALASDEGGEAGLNLAAEVPGWKRYMTAEEWLKGKQKSARSDGTETVLKED